MAADSTPHAGEWAATLIRHCPRVAFGLIPVLIALLHAIGFFELGLLFRLEDLERIRCQY